jgi:ribosomal protein S18 acetylase RimI-like enzyme
MIGIRQIRAGEEAVVLGVAEGLFDNPVRADETVAYLADPANLLLLAFDGKTAVGMLTGTFLRHPDKPLSLFVNELGTREGWQRRGIATQMVQRAIAIARDRGARGVWLGTEEENAEAIAFYRAMGASELRGVFFGWDGAFDEDTEDDEEDGDGSHVQTGGREA